MPVIRFDVEEKATSLDAPVTHKVTANKTPILAGGNDADPIDSMATVSQYLADRYGESARDVNRNYETVAKDYGLSGNPLTDVKTIRAGQLDVEQRQSTTIKKSSAPSAPDVGSLENFIRSIPAGGSKSAYDALGGVGLLIAEDAAMQAKTGMMRDPLGGVFGRPAFTHIGAAEDTATIDEARKNQQRFIKEWVLDVGESSGKVYGVDEGRLSSDVGAAFGQLPLMIVTAGVSAAPMAMAEMVKDAEQTFGVDFADMSDDQRAKVIAAGSAYALFTVGAEKVGMKAMGLKRLDKFFDGSGTVKGSFIKKVLRGTGGEFGTEFVQATSQDQFAKVFDDDRDVKWDDIKGYFYEGAIGAIVGGSVSTGTATADVALRRWFDPVDGMSDQDMSAAQSTAKPDEISDFAEKKYGDEVDEEGTPLKDLAVDAANGDKSARDKLRNAETVEVDPTDAEAGLTAEEVEAAEFGGMESLPPEAEEDLQKRMQADERADVAEVGMESLKEHLTTLPNLEERLTLDDARDKMASFQVELNDMLAAGVDPAEVQRFAEAAVRAAGYDPADPRYAPNRMQIKGRQTSAYEKGVLKATAQIFKDATPFTLLEEVNHGFYDMAVESGEVDVDTVRGWKSEIQDQNPDAPKFDDSDKGVKEWAAYEAGAWAAGERGNDMSALPEGFRRYVEMFLEFAKDVMNFVRRGAELREMAEAGMLPAGMQQFMERSMGMDTDYLTASIRDAEARASAPDPKTELKQFLKTAKVPRPDDDPTFRGELESYFESIGKNWKKMRKGVNSLDELGKAMKEKGFNVDTPDDVVKLLDRSTRGEEIYPNEDSRSAATATDASFSMAPVNPDSPEFKAWFKDSKVVDENGEPLVVYHGTFTKVDRFASNSRGVHFVSPDAEWVSDFVTEEDTDFKEGINILPVYVKSENPFDYENESHLEMLQVKGSLSDSVIDQIRDGDWSRIEDRTTLGNIKNLGFDGVYVEENGVKNLGVFDPTQIKSAISNTGAFDPQDPRISYSLSPVTPEQDADYMAAVESGDTDKAQEMVDEAAKAAGYEQHADFRDAHVAPSNMGATDEDVTDEGWDASMVQVARGVHNQPDDFFEQDFYHSGNKAADETLAALNEVFDEIRGGNEDATITVYRSVPLDVKGDNLENSDWVSPSRTYAVNHGEARFGEGEYRLIEEEVKASDLFWDHNQIEEWGKDDDKNRYYKNTANNVKSADPITYDANGDPIPLSERFNEEDPRISYSMAPMEDVVYDEGDKQYPIASRNVWWGNANFESAGATLEYMSPDEFLKRAKPLEMDEETLENVSDIVDHIRSGRSLDPLSLYREDITDVRASDGRHRALASKELGIQEVPVLVFPTAASFSMAPMEEGESVTSRDRTPEENELAKALADWREDMTTAERKKASDRLKVLQVKAVESRKRQRLIKSAEGKYEKLFNQKAAQLRKQADERTNLTEAVKEMEALINNPKIPTAVRGRLRGYGKLAEKKTDAGKARWLKIMANRLDSEFVKYRRTENRNKLLKFLSPYSTVYAPKLRKLSARVGEESRDLLRFAADLSRNSEAPTPEFLIKLRKEADVPSAREFAMRETFGGVLTREASPEQIDMALKGAGAIAKGGRTEMEDFHKARKARIDDRNEQMKESVLLGEDALDEDEIQRARDTMTTGEKVRSTMMGLLFHPLNGLQQMMNILDVRKGGFMEREFMSAAHEANQEEVAMNVDNAKRTTDDIVGIFKGENRVADGWFKDAQNVVQTKIEWDAGKGKRKRKLSKLQGVSIYMQWLDLSLRPTFENMGIDGETMAKVVEFIGQDGVKLGEYYRARYAETGIDIQGVHKETEGFAMDLVDGYGGRARRAGVAKGEDDVMLAMGGKDSRATVKSGSMKERTGNTLPLLFADASVEFNQHMREANHYISHAQLTKDLQSAFKFDKDVSNAIKQVHGDEFYSSLIKKVDGIIEGGTKAKNIVERSMNTVRANLTKASLGLKPAILIKQLTSAPAFIEEIGFTDYAKASATMARNPLKWMKLVYGTDYVKNRTNTSIYADIQQQLAMRSNMFRGATMSDMMMMNVKYGDVGGVVLGGTPVYIDTYQKAIADGMTEANAHKEAERVFGEASERAQQSSAEFSKGEYLSGQGVMRSFFMYLTSPIQYQRNINVALLNLANSVINSRAGKEADVQTARKQAVRAVIVYHFILPQIFQAVASGLTAFTSDDDEIVDQFWRRQARAAILGNLSTFPVLGQIMSGLANEISGAGEFFRSSGSPVVDFSGKAGADILRAFKSGGETEDVVKVIEDAASLKGWPVKTGLDYAESLSELDDSDHPMLKILGWSDWAIGE